MFVNPLISCIVAIYNVEKYLPQCIESLINQEYENVEIILVNDGSTDNSLRISEKYAALDQRIKIISQLNQGANVARNAGVASAHGDWIYFVDGDDYVKSDVFTYIQSELVPENDLVIFSNEKQIGDRVKIIEYPMDRLEFERKEAFDDIYELSLATMNRLGDSKYNYRYMDTVSIWTKCYRRSFLVQNDLSFVPKFPKCQDLIFNLEVFEKAKRAVFINHCGYVYRINEGSVTVRYQEDFLNKLDVMTKWFEQFMERYPDDARMQEAYRGRILTFLRTAVVIYFCNPNNKKSYAIRKQEFKQLLKLQPYKSVLVNCSPKKLPFQEGLLTWCIRKKSFLGCEVLNRLRNVFQ